MTAPEAKVYIVGVGSDGLGGLTARARDILTSADIILGSEPTLDLVRRAAGRAHSGRGRSQRRGAP